MKKRVGISTIGILLHHKSVSIVRDIAPDEVEFVMEFNEKGPIEGNFEKSLHASHHYTNIAALNDSALSFAESEVEKLFKFHLSIVVHEGRSITGFDDWKSISFNRMEKLLQRLSGKGTILLENVTPSSYFSDINAFFDFVMRFDDLFVCLDIAHIFANEGNLKNLFSLKDRFKERIAKIHISDTTDGKDLHLPLHEGVLPLSEISAFLKEFGVPLINEAVPRSVSDFTAFFKNEVEKTRELYE